MTQFKTFLKVRNMPDIEDLDLENLPNILSKFYTAVCTKKAGEQYQIGSFKVIRAALNRYFKQ